MFFDISPVFAAAKELEYPAAFTRMSKHVERAAQICAMFILHQLSFRILPQVLLSGPGKFLNI